MLPRTRASGQKFTRTPACTCGAALPIISGIPHSSDIVPPKLRACVSVSHPSNQAGFPGVRTKPGTYSSIVWISAYKTTRLRKINTEVLWRWLRRCFADCVILWFLPQVTRGMYLKVTLLRGREYGVALFSETRLIIHRHP